MIPRIRKYPRTPHLQGSRLQPGDEDLASVPFGSLAGRHVVVVEKMDGANAAISFDPDGRLLLQSRGHYLAGGPRERHFDPFKQWASAHAGILWETLGARYVLYGEWLYAKHTIYYDRLTHYFLEFDILDTAHDQFLDTPRRLALLAGTPVRSVLVLHAGVLDSQRALGRLLGRSRFIGPQHLDRLRGRCEELGIDQERALAETDADVAMEGLYLKVEEGGMVCERYKYVRASFLTTVVQSESHWLDRPIVPNELLPGVDLWDPRPIALVPMPVPAP